MLQKLVDVGIFTLNPAKCMVMRFEERVDDNCGNYQIFGEFAVCQGV